jgi:hypothetical protein
MGYDFEWAVLPEPAASARRRYDLCAESDEPCTHEPECAGEYLASADPYRFHLNVSGMADCRRAMAATGMTHAAPLPRDTAAETAGSAWTVPGMAGIPAFKFQSNGPWSVSATEVTEALAIYEGAGPPLSAELESDWSGDAGLSGCAKLSTRAGSR